MNCFSGTIVLIGLLLTNACHAPASEPDRTPSSHAYSVHYTITPNPNTGSVTLDMAVRQDNGQLKELIFDFTNKKISDIQADGELRVDGSTVYWSPRPSGGNLSWVARPSARRRGNGFDALLSSEWGIFRAEDVIPRARTRTIKDADGITTMSFELPSGWTAVSEYSSIDSEIAIDNPSRRFDQPSGWIAVGELGVRRETIAGTRIAIAAPQGEAARRMDMLALLNWTIPELTDILGEPIPRLTIVSAGDPMWRGGLSAPASLFIHADRPLISENATSTLVHEVVHVGFDIKATNGFDWIVEGLAEYYSLELLHRGGAITTRRYRRALEQQADWADQATTLCAATSAGPTTARAVTIFRRLNEEIESQSGGTLNLDALVEKLNGIGVAIDFAVLQDAATSILGAESGTLILDDLPGCAEFAEAEGKA